MTLLAALVAACSKTYIPNTDVEDTSQNRDVVVFCEKYRHAMEDKDVAQILKMMSPGYFEDGGNTKNEDDADFDKIREFLTGDFLRTGSIRYEIRYRRVTFAENNHIFVDYTYAAAWKLPGVKQEEWHHKVADNRLDLVREGESFKIVGGM
jgi:predicted ATP-dependent Lon-type protease